MPRKSSVAKAQQRREPCPKLASRVPVNPERGQVVAPEQTRQLSISSELQA